MKWIISLILAFALSSVVAPPVARADDPREVEGRAAFSKGDYARALDIFARLYAEASDPVYLRNIGRCQQKLRQPDEAIESFRSYLRRARRIKPAERKEIEGYIAEMEALKATMTATMRDEAAAAAAAATDKAARGAERPAPAEKAAPPPPSATAEGGSSSATGKTEPSETPPPVTRLRRGDAESTDAGPSTADGKIQPARSGGGSWHAPVAWVGVGLTVVAAGVGVFGILRNHSLVSEFDQSCAIEPTTDRAYAVPMSSHSDASCITLRNNYSLASQVAVGAFVGAAVLGGVSLVIALTAPTPARESSSEVSWSCAPGFTPGHGPSVGCHVRF